MKECLVGLREGYEVYMPLAGISIESIQLGGRCVTDNYDNVVYVVYTEHRSGFLFLAMAGYVCKPYLKFSLSFTSALHLLIPRHSFGHMSTQCLMLRV